MRPSPLRVSRMVTTHPFSSLFLGLVLTFVLTFIRLFFFYVNPYTSSTLTLSVVTMSNVFLGLFCIIVLSVFYCVNSYPKAYLNPILDSYLNFDACLFFSIVLTLI